jgi:hypothetical protein
MTITVDEITADFTRDRWGRPLVSDPNGGAKPIPYGRPSSFGDMIADKFNLQKWGKRQVVVGMANTPSLAARVMAAGGDKKLLDAIAEDALTAAKSNERADIGTALHRIIERQIAGEDVELVEPYAADVRAFWDCLTATGFKIHQLDGRPMSEIKCVNDDWQLAGTFDLVLEGPDGTCYIADLKTGASLDFGHIGYAVQLAVYRDSSLYDCDSGARSDMPKCHRGTGIIIHLPAGEARCSLHDVDLERGREMARLCAAVRDVRKVKTITARACAPSPTTTPDPDYLHADLLERINAIKATKPAFDQLLASWPTGVPTPKNSGQWADEHMQPIIDTLRAVEREHSLPFLPEPFEPAPTPHDVAVLSGLITVPEAREFVAQPDNEGPLDADAAAEIITAMHALGPMVAQANAWAAQARDAGGSLSISQLPSQRRRHIATAITAVCSNHADEADGFMRQCLNLIMETDLQPAVTTGAALGALTISEAERLETLTCS